MEKNKYSIMTNDVISGQYYEYIGFKTRKEARRVLNDLKKAYKKNVWVCVCEEGIDMFAICNAFLHKDACLKGKYYIKRNY